MRFVLVIDDNGEEFTEASPDQVTGEVLEVLYQTVARLTIKDRSGAVYAEDNRPIGGFEIILGHTEGRPGWERTR